MEEGSYEAISQLPSILSSLALIIKELPALPDPSKPNGAQASLQAVEGLLLQELEKVFGRFFLVSDRLCVCVVSVGIHFY